MVSQRKKPEQGVGICPDISSFELFVGVVAVVSDYSSG